MFAQVLAELLGSGIGASNKVVRAFVVVFSFAAALFFLGFGGLIVGGIINPQLSLTARLGGAVIFLGLAAVCVFLVMRGVRIKGENHAGET